VRHAQATGLAAIVESVPKEWKNTDYQDYCDDILVILVGKEKFPVFTSPDSKTKYHRKSCHHVAQMAEVSCLSRLSASCTIPPLSSFLFVAD
jgi:hypothetical protein